MRSDIMDLKVIPYSKIEGRWCLVDNNDNIVDDAQGYGYKTVENAKKAGWYKFNGGEAKHKTNRGKAKAFWKKNPDLLDLIENLLFISYKEDETVLSNKKLKDILLRDYGKDIDIQFFKYM